LIDVSTVSACGDPLDHDLERLEAGERGSGGATPSRSPAL
jgi:hypothetical protein